MGIDTRGPGHAILPGPGRGLRGPETLDGGQSPASVHPLGLRTRARTVFVLVLAEGRPPPCRWEACGGQRGLWRANWQGCSVLSWLRVVVAAVSLWGQAGRSPEGSERAGSALSRLCRGPRGVCYVNSRGRSQQASRRTASYMSLKCLCICFPWPGTGCSSRAASGGRWFPCRSLVYRPGRKTVFSVKLT